MAKGDFKQRTSYTGWHTIYYYPSHNQTVMGITCTVTLTVILLAQSIFLSATPKQSKDLFVDKLPNHISFQKTENLSYEVNWKPLFLSPSFKAGELSFSINISEYKQTPTSTISAWAISDGPLMSVANLKVKNYFE